MFYFVRHGEPDYSKRGQEIYRGFGSEFAPLTENGIRQIEAAARDERLRGASLILSSPYTRALESAAILSRALDAPVAVEGGLHEWLANKYFVYEDDETAQRAYAEYNACRGEYPNGEERDWEDAPSIRSRALSVLARYAGRGKVIVAAHGMLIQAVTGAPHPAFGGIVPWDLPGGQGAQAALK